MTYREHPPCAALAPYVDRLWSSADAAGATRLVLPDGCIDILIDLARPDAPIVVGAMTAAARFEASGARIVAVRFKPGAAAPLLRHDACELTDASAGDVPWLRVDPRAPLASFEASLVARVRAIEATVDPMVAFAVGRLTAGTAPTIGGLERETGLSRQYLARLFKRDVGLSPKQLGRIARMQRAITWLQRRPGAELAAAALHVGYFDQAHMARDFRALAELTPAAARAVSIHPIQSLYGAP